MAWEQLPWNDRILQLEGLSAQERAQATALVLGLLPAAWEAAVPKHKAVALACLKRRLAKAAEPPGKCQRTDEGAGTGSRAAGDRSNQLVATLVNALQPLGEPGDEAACLAFLSDHSQFRIPVPSDSLPDVQPHLDVSRRQLLLPEEWNAASAQFWRLLSSTPLNHGADLTATVMVTNLLSTVFRLLQTFTASGLPVDVLLKPTDKGAGCRRGGGGGAGRAGLERPDTLVVYGSTVLMVGEDRKERGMEQALADLWRHVKEGLGACQYCDIPGIPAYVASGQQLQFCFITRAGQVKTIGPTLHLSQLNGRLDAVCYAVQCYRLLVLLASRLPPAQERLRLWMPMHRPPAVVMLTPAGATKTIQPFSAFAQGCATSQGTLERAYAAAAAAAAAQARLGERPFMVSARAGPWFSDDTFWVQTAPLGYPRTVGTEKDARHVAWACLKTASVLHKAGLVHSDFRLENTKWLDQEHCLVLDLESCKSATTPLPEHFEPRADWTDRTLETKGAPRRRRQFFTPASDLYQIGRLVQELLGPDSSEAARALVQLLLSKQALHADAALAHCWFAAAL